MTSKPRITPYERHIGTDTSSGRAHGSLWQKMWTVSVDFTDKGEAEDYAKLIGKIINDDKAYDGDLQTANEQIPERQD